jgi:cell wall-associated NlpC family hydrolase
LIRAGVGLGRGRFAIAVFLVVALGGCRLVGKAPSGESSPRPGGARPAPPEAAGARPTRPPVEPSPEARSSREVERITSGVVETALDAIGTPYVWGGTDANGFDCSGLIQYAYAAHDIQIPRVSRDQIRAGRDVVPRVEALLPGDILGFTTDVNRTISHVGLYVGEGRFIHSSSSGVRLSNLQDPYWREHVVAARRVVW